MFQALPDKDAETIQDAAYYLRNHHGEKTLADLELVGDAKPVRFQYPYAKYESLSLEVAEGEALPNLGGHTVYFLSLISHAASANAARWARIARISRWLDGFVDRAFCASRVPRRVARSFAETRCEYGSVRDDPRHLPRA